MGLDKDLRVILEGAFDRLLSEPKEFEEAFSMMLRVEGIEPDLDAILSYISGYMEGLANAYYTIKYDRTMTKEERKEFIDLMRRRAWELRQAFISTRIEE